MGIRRNTVPITKYRYFIFLVIYYTCGKDKNIERIGY